MRYIFRKQENANEQNYDAEFIKILIVDDLPEKLLVYESILEDLGPELIKASSGEQALKLVLQHEFAVILLDVNMPGLDGFETAKLIHSRKKSAHTPIIFLTASNDEPLIAQGYASGGVDYLPVPIVPEILRAKVRVFIELFQMRRQAASQAEEYARRKAAEENAARSMFLAEFSEVIARAQSREEIMSALARMPIPYMGNMCIISLADDNGLHQVQWCSSTIGENESHAYPMPKLSWLDEVVKLVMETGQMQVLSELPSTPSFLAIECAIALPIMVRGKTCGVFILAREEANLPWQVSEISLASDLISRAGVSLENSFLIQKIRDDDRRKDEFMCMLAHELRNPLAPIRNAVHLLQLMSSKESNISQLRDIVERQIAHMSRLIDDLLDTTRLNNGQILLQKERCDLVKIVRQTAEDYKGIFDKNNLLLEVNVPSEDIWINGDQTRLIQAIGNLLHNAHKFTDEGGFVSIDLKYIEEQKLAEISVRDSGIGIDPNILPYIFDVFRQAEQGLDRSRGGLGLGLSLVKGLVKLHGGEVSVVSHGINKGSEFIISLPAQIGFIKETSNQYDTPSTSKSRILVIEDNVDAAETIKLLLNHYGHEVKIANSGSEGLKVAPSFSANIILCDIGLPGMDGYQVISAIRQDPELSSSYVIAITGYGKKEDQMQMLQHGFNMYLTKPINSNNLLQVIEQAQLGIRVSEA